MSRFVGFLIWISHVKFEIDLSTEERSQFVNFGQMDYTSLQSKNGLSRLLTNRTYDSDMIYRVVKKVRNLQYDDIILKFIELGNYLV